MIERLVPVREGLVLAPGAAKESLDRLAVPSTAALVGLALSYGLVAVRLYRRRETS